MAQHQSFQELFRLDTTARQQSQQAEHTDSRCPACNAPTAAQADICEACGVWLLEGKCNFCYADFKTDQKFCGNCGNPPRGISCKTCGTISHFDFCPQCSTPLSKKAAPALQALLDSAEMQSLRELRDAANTSRSPANIPANQLSQLNAYLKNTGKPQHKPSDNPFRFTGDNKDFSPELEASEQSFKKIEQENKRVDDTLLKAKIKELQEKVFSDNQAARLFYTSIKLMLPELKSCNSFIGWKCNYANFIHYFGPSDCACPGMGGHWVCKDDVQWTSGRSFVYDGFTYTEGTETKGVHQD